MKYNKETKHYEDKNVKFSAVTMKAYSYEHWQFLGKTDEGKVIFNNFNYSMITGKHQKDVLSILNILQKPIDLVIYHTKKSLREGYKSVLKDEIILSQEAIMILKERIKNPKTHKKRNLKRKDEVNHLLKHIEHVETILEHTYTKNSI